MNYHLHRDELLESVLHLATFLQNSLDGSLLVVAVDEKAKVQVTGKLSEGKSLSSEFASLKGESLESWHTAHRAPHLSGVHLRNRGNQKLGEGNRLTSKYIAEGHQLGKSNGTNSKLKLSMYTGS